MEELKKLFEEYAESIDEKSDHFHGTSVMFGIPEFLRADAKENVGRILKKEYDVPPVLEGIYEKSIPGSRIGKKLFEKIENYREALEEARRKIDEQLFVLTYQHAGGMKNGSGRYFTKEFICEKCENCTPECKVREEYKIGVVVIPDIELDKCNGQRKWNDEKIDEKQKIRQIICHEASHAIFDSKIPDYCEGKTVEELDESDKVKYEAMLDSFAEILSEKRKKSEKNWLSSLDKGKEGQ